MRETTAEQLAQHTNDALCDAKSIDISDLRVRRLVGETGLAHCKQLTTLLASRNRISTLETKDVLSYSSTDQVGLLVESLPLLWKIDVSRNPLGDLSGLEGFFMLGFLDVSNCQLDYESLAVIANIYVFFLDTRGNPKLSAEFSSSEYRYNIIHLLPRVWVLDGVFISRDERRRAEDFFSSREKDKDHPVTRALEDAEVGTVWSSVPTDLPRVDWMVQVVLAKEPRRASLSDAYRLRYVLQLFEEQHRLESKRVRPSQIAGLMETLQHEISSEALMSTVALLYTQSVLLASPANTRLRFTLFQDAVSVVLRDSVPPNVLVDLCLSFEYASCVRQSILHQLLDTLVRLCDDERLADAHRSLVQASLPLRFFCASSPDDEHDSANAWVTREWVARGVTILAFAPIVKHIHHTITDRIEERLQTMARGVYRRAKEQLDDGLPPSNVTTKALRTNDAEPKAKAPDRYSVNPNHILVSRLPCPLPWIPSTKTVDAHGSCQPDMLDDMMNSCTNAFMTQPSPRFQYEQRLASARRENKGHDSVTPTAVRHVMSTGKLGVMMDESQARANFLLCGKSQKDVRARPSTTFTDVSCHDMQQTMVAPLARRSFRGATNRPSRGMCAYSTRVDDLGAQSTNQVIPGSSEADWKRPSTVIINEPMVSWHRSFGHTPSRAKRRSRGGRGSKLASRRKWYAVPEKSLLIVDEGSLVSHYPAGA